MIAYRWITRGGRDDEAKEAFHVFDKKDRNVVGIVEIRSVLQEYINPQMTDEEIKEFMREIDPNN